MGSIEYTLTVYTTSGASVVVNGVNQTANSSGYAYYKLKKGTYSYSVSKSGYTSRSGSVIVTMNKTLSIPLTKNYVAGDFYYINNTIIGVMINSYQYVSLYDQASSYVSWSSALSYESSYNVQGVSGWKIPEKSEWTTMYENKSVINASLGQVGSRIANDWYWVALTNGAKTSCDFSNLNFWSPAESNRVRLIHNA
jgi:hypothetical protein